MGLSILGSLAVIALLHISRASAQGACPTLFNYYSHPTDCTKFYRCFWGSPVEFVCPAGTHWNQQILTCDHAYKVPCVSAILNPIYKLIKNDGYGYVTSGYGNRYGTRGYVKGSYAGYDTTGARYEGSYVKANDYGNYGSYYGNTRNTFPPRFVNNFGRYVTRNRFNNYQNGGYGRAGYARYPAYGGYIAGGYARNSAGYGQGYVRSPTVSRVFDKTWKK